jgi:hypothetical protein
MHVLCKPKILSTQEVRQLAPKYCSWEMVFKVWTVSVSIIANAPISLFLLPFNSNASQAHRFAPTALLLLPNLGGSGNMDP